MTYTPERFRDTWDPVYEDTPEDLADMDDEFADYDGDHSDDDFYDD